VRLARYELSMGRGRQPFRTPAGDSPHVRRRLDASKRAGSIATMPNIAQNSMPNNSQSDSIILWFCVRNTRHNPRSGVFMGQSGTWWWVNRLRQRVVGMGRVGDRQHQHLGNRFLRLYFLKSPRSRLAFRPTRARSTSAFRLGNLSRTVFHKTSRSIRS
jgi:hypothetical protein